MKDLDRRCWSAVARNNLDFRHQTPENRTRSVFLRVEITKVRTTDLSRSMKATNVKCARHSVQIRMRGCPLAGQDRDIPRYCTRLEF